MLCEVEEEEGEVEREEGRSVGRDWGKGGELKEEKVGEGKNICRLQLGGEC